MGAKVRELGNLNDVSAKTTVTAIFINMKIGSMFVQEAVHHSVLQFFLSEYPCVSVVYCSSQAELDGS